MSARRNESKGCRCSMNRACCESIPPSLCDSVLLPLSASPAVRLQLTRQSQSDERSWAPLPPFHCTAMVTMMIRSIGATVSSAVCWAACIML